MRLSINTAEATVFVGSDAEATPINYWSENKPAGQASDPANPSLLAWNVKGELCQPNEKPEDIKIKMFSATPPSLNPRTEYRIEGSLFAVPYLTASGRVEVSFTLNGKLVPVAKQQVGRAE